MDYVIGEALIVIPVLLVIGGNIKTTPQVKDWTIPYILLILGVAITVGIMGVNIDALIQGILVSGAAVFGNQLWKQATEGKDDKK